ncbi:hypothetical protein [Chryseobacterium sp. JUb7]|uniref:hypothetical protein n=1 Tax=Chryseobacterium sp. JUb7 TaxID=2940599 RepID=UPI00216A669C|nr:hypothetical protein [Chryseobacterium sp. JUb7]MCS3531862.1 hypothetical protein [Chryseobacterium sp. JUb7]
MKKISLFLLLLIGTIAYAQAGAITIYNFSAYNVTYRLVGSQLNAFNIDCQPVVTGYPVAPLAPSSSVTYPTYNSSYLQTPAINEWYVISDENSIPSQNYNVSTGATIPPQLSNLTAWHTIDLNFSNGGFINLGVHCGGGGTGIFSGATTGNITATWNALGNNVIVFIN